ncbi:M-phase inducer phosphatase 1-like [Mercenaria mercenaria]|uniref:M-phase inducer phosphatase 1-like n=1 Tax=Mercenaria mercenaria TaxID=6596 RepID=UPI00234F683E|nr:M-phase inducer phosphatase 1-like [Mercenaria mercenaria]
MSIRQRLFGSLTDSPVYRETTDAEIQSIISPNNKGEDSVDSGFVGDTPCSIEIASRSKVQTKTEARRSLFSVKRLADDDLTDYSPCTKKLRQVEDDFAAMTTQNVIKAVERLESRDLVADGSRDYTLPTVPGKHGDLKSITHGTMADVLDGKYSHQIGKVTIVDCRYPYEFDGGHIQNAVNMYTKDDVNSLLQSRDTSEKPHILVFHCEFSSERGPKMYRFLRSQDRELNKEQYPRLNFPEVYLLDGGYKAFFTTLKEYCEPASYKPMLNEDHVADLRHFRVKSKSWTEGEKQKTNKRQRSRLNRHLSF